MIVVKVDAKNEISHVGAIPSRVRSILKGLLMEIGGEFADYVRGTKFSGNPLQSRSGRLAGSISPQEDKSSSGDIAISVQPRGVPYADYHEYGFRGTEHVRAHTRLITQVFGRPYSGTAEVSAHDRQVNYAGRPYMRPSLAEYEPTAVSRIESALHEAFAVMNR